VEKLPKLFECLRHFSIELVVKKSKVKFHVVAYYRFFGLTDSFHDPAEANLIAEE
jgi:hypothetical protein